MAAVEFLVEEPSAEEVLRHLLPKLLPRGHQANIRNLQSKYNLLKVLEARLRAYAIQINHGEDIRIVVLIDRDSDDCLGLKANLEQRARRVGLYTKSSARQDERFCVVNRIVVEELESWFIGDPSALRRAFTSLPRINANKGIFRNPDNGGSWEALHRFLKANGIYRKSFPKIEAARKIAPHMIPGGEQVVELSSRCAGFVWGRLTGT